MRFHNFHLEISVSKKISKKVHSWLKEKIPFMVVATITVISAGFFLYFYNNGLGLAYNDARSHLDISRRVVEGLKPGLAQLGSVWLPLPHLLMVPTVWNDFFWHSGLSGAIVSMISFVLTNILIYQFLKSLNVGYLGRIFGLLVFSLNLNILYLQSTAMTELLLLATMTAGSYYLLLWYKNDKDIIYLLKSAFFIMLSTLVRYDGWFLLAFVAALIGLTTLIKKGYKQTEGTIILFVTLAALGVGLWVLWNLVIFGDPLYFAFGPFSAHTQQQQLEAAGNLPTKGNLLESIRVYFYALVYNSIAFNVILGSLGAITLWSSKKISLLVRVATLTLIAPLLFNILALYMGHSVLFIQGISGNTWFNARYGIMLMPSIAIFAGVLIDRFKEFRFTILGLFFFVTFFAFINTDAVTIDDATVGSSQKNVTEVSDWLKENAKDKDGFVLISAASHDAIIFSSSLKMKKFIHEGTGAYWESATTAPDRWARWIVMRTHDDNDLVWKSVSKSDGFSKFNLIESYPFADIYELDEKYLRNLTTKSIINNL